MESDQTAAYKIISVNNNHSKIDANRIREALKRRKCDGSANKKLMEAVDPGIDSEARIERELENGIELESTFFQKETRNCDVLTY